MAETDYTTIDRPYDTLMQRSETLYDKAPSVDTTSSNTSDTSTLPTSQSATSGANGSVEVQPVKSDGAMGDVWITNFIRSQNWKPKNVGFYIDGQTGYAEFTNVYVSGNIQALTGQIGGFTIGATDLSVTASGYTTSLSSGTTAISTGPTGSPLFTVTRSGIITASSGTIGGCVLGATSIGSTTFASGPLGNGWNISNTGVAEFQNVTIRGMIKTSVFEKETASAVGGYLLITPSDVLDVDMTDLDSSTMTTKNIVFPNNSVLRIKDGVNDEYVLVVSSTGLVHTITRDLSGNYAPNSNPTWKEGTAIVSTGVGTGTKTGYILMDSSSTYSPCIDIYGRNSNTYTDTTLHTRLGWLKGITDLDVGLNSTDVWGLYSDNVYLKGTINALSGKFGTSTNYWNVGATGLTAVSTSTDVIINYGKTDFGQDSTAGFIIGYDYSASVSKIEFGSNSTKIFKYDGTDLSMIGGTITGGTIQTSSGTTYVKMTGSDNSLSFSKSGKVTARMYPNAVQGVGWTLDFYDDQNTNTKTGYLDYEYYWNGGTYYSQTIAMNIYAQDLGSAAGIGIFSDSDYPTKKRLQIGAQLDSSILNFDGFNDLGNSTNKFNNIWCDTLHYVTLTQISDKRLKKNIDPLEYGLAEINLLNPIKFKWKGNNERGYGFIAQEIRQVIPVMVRKVEEIDEEFIRQPDGRKKKIRTKKDVRVADDPTGEAMLQIDMSPMIPILVKAIQELSVKIENLELRISQL